MGGLDPQHLVGGQRSKCPLGTSRDVEAEGERGGGGRPGEAELSRRVGGKRGSHLVGRRG